MSKRFSAALFVVLLSVAAPVSAVPRPDDPQFRDREPRIVKIIKKAIRSLSYELTDPKP